MSIEETKGGEIDEVVLIIFQIERIDILKRKQSDLSLSLSLASLSYQCGEKEMIIGADHAHLQGHFQHRSRVGIVQIQDDVGDVASDGVDQHTAIFVVCELPDEDISLIDTWIVEQFL